MKLKVSVSEKKISAPIPIPKLVLVPNTAKPGFDRTLVPNVQAETPQP